MSPVPVTQEIEQAAAKLGIKPEQIVWCDENVFGILVGLANGTSRYVVENEPLPRQF